MKALVLAGGFALRLGHLAEDTPKALIPLTPDGKPVIDFVLDKLELIDGLKDVFVSTNDKFSGQFGQWLNRKRASPRLKLELVTIKAVTDQEKPGPVATVHRVIKEKNIDEDLLVVAGDNLFDFDLCQFVSTSCSGMAAILGCYKVRSVEETEGMGVIWKDNNGLVTKFKAKSLKPDSLLVSTAVYLFPADSLCLIGQYLADPVVKKSTPKPGPGDLIEWLIEHKHQVRAVLFQGMWIDIGTPARLEKAKAAVAK